MDWRSSGMIAAAWWFWISGFALGGGFEHNASFFLTARVNGVLSFVVSCPTGFSMRSTLGRIFERMLSIKVEKAYRSF